MGSCVHVQDAVPTAAQDSKQDRVAEDSRRAETVQKVQQIKDNMERKRRARARYEEHVKHTLALAGTDYAKWDLWCPEDEEDELVATCTPDNAQLKAMEKDIDERHQRYGIFACRQSLCLLQCCYGNQATSGEPDDAS